MKKWYEKKEKNGQLSLVKEHSRLGSLVYAIAYTNDHTRLTKAYTRELNKIINATRKDYSKAYDIYKEVKGMIKNDKRF